jgi:hypothetical protein
LRAVF